MEQEKKRSSFDRQEPNNPFLPMIVDGGKNLNSTVIDAALAAKLSVHDLKKMKACEFAIQIMSGRSGKSDPETIDKLINTFFKQLTNVSNN